ncbi:phage integrase family protein [Asticcacaulis biprosthecium C19]|uniref:Phage integrase family protein n=1 Tax=Asticcacaulis biprosthecium C19 TaxID=715226 RepID=F4QI36_9CAUL|nr:site-specific integrase [Asticcacaulis biprosthecium]EGF92903.1 phage integrase family protein [Asticcacaulis biprosthecium C19]
MSLQKGRISKAVVDAIACPDAGEVWFWDDKLSGFFVRVYASGRKVYAVKYRLGKAQRIFTIGTHGSPWTPEKAREKATAVLKDVGNNIDPAAEKLADRHAMTVADLVKEYIERGPQTKANKRAVSWAADESCLRRHIIPTVGKDAADRLTNEGAAKAIYAIRMGKTAVVEKSDKPRGKAVVTGGEAVARRTRSVAAAMFAWGIKHGLVKRNPFTGIDLPAAPVKERFLSQAEAGAFLDALAGLEAEGSVDRVYGDALRLLLLTGARKSEIANLTWSEVDFDRRCLVLPPERTKAGGKTGERRIMLMPAALEILSRRYKARSDYVGIDGKPLDLPLVFPSPRTLNTTGGPIVGLRRIFAKACLAADIKGVRLHDMRHSFASFAVAGGASLFLVSKLLGHSNSRTTERYAHLSADPLQEVVNHIEQKLFSSPKVISICPDKQYG